jgi:EAL domain-containing protein (putative c-di-GMP-specific phosphodiesterase class I)
MVVPSYTADLPSGAIDRTDPDEQLEAAVATALADPAQPRLVFQPIVDLQRSTVVGFETLSRFCSPLSATPDLWFAAADRLGVGARLQADVVRRGIALLPSLPPDTFLTVNLDPRLVVAPEIVGLLTGSGRLDRLVIELTEQTVMTDVRAMLARLDQAREAGAIVAMDDTGSGYASLQNLLTIRPELVKLDRSLISGIDRDIVRRSLVAMLGEFVGQLDAWVLAEGLETPEELQTCVDLGVPLGQGWLLGRPADDWVVEIPGSVTEAIHGRVLLREFPDTLAMLLDIVPAVTSEEDARRALADEPQIEHVVMVDRLQRPLAIIDRAVAEGHKPSCGRPLLVRISESVQDVARRVVMRDADTRFEPVVCRDEQGRYQGMVTVDQLLHALAGDGDGRQ